MSEQTNRVHVLHHVRQDAGCRDDAKLIGVYRSQEAVDAAIARLSERPGFRDFPEGFSTDAYELDKDHWSEGFVEHSHLR